MKKTFLAPEISCNHCKVGIEKALEGVKLNSFSINLEKKEIEFDYDEDVVLEEAIKKIDEIGFSLEQL